MRPSATVRRLPARKRIALVAHDHRKAALVAWVEHRRAQVAGHELVGRGTTAGEVQRATGLPVRGLLSGPLGGDQQLGALVAEGGVDVMIFFWDPLESVPHDPDVPDLAAWAAAGSGRTLPRED
jgi:methylglyoxal synthase